MENHHFEWENSLFLWPFSIKLPEGNCQYKDSQQWWNMKSTFSLAGYPPKLIQTLPDRGLKDVGRFISTQN
jgi:hypothetical protein